MCCSVRIHAKFAISAMKEAQINQKIEFKRAHKPTIEKITRDFLLCELCQSGSVTEDITRKNCGYKCVISLFYPPCSSVYFSSWDEVCTHLVIASVKISNTQINITMVKVELTIPCILVDSAMVCGR